MTSWATWTRSAFYADKRGMKPGLFTPPELPEEAAIAMSPEPACRVTITLSVVAGLR
jgi:hypothetical protein